MPKGQKLQLRPDDLKLYEFILAEYRQTFKVPKLEAMGRFLGVGRFAVRTRLSRLIRAGLIEITHEDGRIGEPYKLPAGAWKENESNAEETKNIHLR